MIISAPVSIKALIHRQRKKLKFVSVTCQSIFVISGFRDKVIATSLRKKPTHYQP